eukprot:927300-Alexandrium_andersonii.AAC.1
MYLVILNEAVGKAVVAACKGGLLDAFAHRHEVRARFLSVKMQKRFVDSCARFEDLLRRAAGKMEQYWEVVRGE